MHRVLIAGITGSGKTTLARQLAPTLGLPYHELDDLYYGPGMHMSPAFPREIERIAADGRWLFDSQGAPIDSEAPPELRDLLWSRADTLVWLDYPRRVVLGRAVSRSIRRIITRETLWQGYRDSPRQWLRPDHPIRRVWRLSRVRREELAARLQEPSWKHLTVIRLRTPRETATWLADVAARQGGRLG